MCHCLQFRKKSSKNPRDKRRRTSPRLHILNSSNPFGEKKKDWCSKCGQKHTHQNFCNATADSGAPTSPCKTSCSWTLNGSDNNVEDDRDKSTKDDQEDEVTWFAEVDESIIEEDVQSVDAEERDDSAGDSGLEGFDWKMGTMTATASTALFAELQQLQAEVMALADLDFEDEGFDIDVGTWNECCHGFNNVCPGPL